MAHSTYFYTNGPDNTESTGSTKHSSVGYCLETPYGYQIDLDFLKYVDNIERTNTIRRLSLQRRLRAANPISEPQDRLGPTQWTSSESLSSVSSDEVHRGSFSSSSSSSSSMSHRRPPLPPSHSSPSLTGGNEASQPPVASQRALEGKPPTATLSSALPRSNPHVERTLLETRQRLEQEKASLSAAVPEPHPRRRLASFGGVGSSGSLSPYTSWKALNQSLQAGSAKLSVAEQPGQGMSSLGGTTGGSLRHSPLSSGRATPVTGVSPLHLQLVRDQMMVALQRLKDLEEQVKAIPVLQVKISVLQEEKRQLVSQVKNLKGEDTETDASFRKRAHSTGSAEQLELQRYRLRKEAEGETTGDNPDILKTITTTGLKEFRQLTAEMQALEKKIKDARLETRHGVVVKASHIRGNRSVAVGDDLPVDKIGILHQSSVKLTKDVATEVKLDTRSAAVGVSESMLGASSAEMELESQQHTIQVLKDQVRRLEAELKDMALQKEMGLLRNELRNAAGARNHKSSTAQPLTFSAGSQTRAQTRSLGVGNHPNMQDASTGEQAEQKGWGISVGVSCKPDTRCVATGHDTPMNHWVVREKVKTSEKCVGDHVSTRCQGVCTETSICEAGVLTEETMETLSQWARKVDQRTVGCGDCTVDVTVTPLKAQVSRGTVTDTVRGVDLGIMVTPCTASQRTNTAVDTVSRFTSTAMAFVTESSTNTSLNTTKEKHTNTMSNLTRSIAIGEGKVKDTEATVRMRSIGVGTSVPGDMVHVPCVSPVAKVTTRDTGVGLANVHENFLVGLRTRNIACGPSRLPDPTKTRSIGIGVGDGRLRDASGHWQTLTQTTQTHAQPQPSAALEPGLDHYIERMQRLLKEQQSLLTESHSELGEVMAQPQAHFTSISTQLASTLSCLDSVVRHAGPDEPQPQHKGSGASPSSETAEKSPGRKKSPKGEKKSSDLLGPPSDALSLKPIIKRKDGHQCCEDSRKYLKLNPVGLEGMVMSEDSNSEGSDSDGAVDTATSERRESSGRPVAEQRRNRGQLDKRDRYELSEKTLSACHTLKTHLCDGQTLSSRELRSCLNTLQQEWFRVSSQKAAQAGAVGDFLCAAHHISPLVQNHVANMADGNGNTALHYSVSHSNFNVVKKLLDADVCNVDQQNKAGYTSIMLAALAAVETKADMGVVEELFRKGDVNAKASQAGQTALMLAVSHGRMDMVRALLISGSEVNIQDDEGSTALMCASEHGHADIVKLLLAQPGCDATLSDNDESTALSIALEAGHKDIAMLLYAHINFSKGQTPGTPRLGNRLAQIQ
ncbi:KN motif and ankyrin repeat domain-containing protein 1b isoform X1 [Alosa sapidissima]|uniref:KN motif and ankyrin repeat domain-containing protein 1b isoform X1 n=2 Tax=Alosa sapidissima TaxID=34773 RepID=UPI001C082AD2|nr:KN motif and ankyrin repeat domain-containing protein 1b isoform X1 [Alosa sapidissima]